jgi:hypothetical protein
MLKGCEQMIMITDKRVIQAANEKYLARWKRIDFPRPISTGILLIKIINS